MIHTFSYAANSETGLVRKNNQDAFAVAEELGLLVVADGMGGHRAGEVASKVAVETVCEVLLQENWSEEGDEMQTLLKLGSAVEKANLAIRQQSESQPEMQGMGTTVVAVLFRLNRFFVAHVGDSRLYRMRQGRLEQITRDHSLVQQLLDAGTFQTVQQAEAAGIGSNVLTRALGIEDQVEVDVADEVLETGDMFLLCSDGLTNMVADHDIKRIINHYHADLDAAAERLMLGALSAGGLDNITLVLARPDIG
jgi:serine/threonine protein phosphatase PrpC